MSCSGRTPAYSIKLTAPGGCHLAYRTLLRMSRAQHCHQGQAYKLLQRSQADQNIQISTNPDSPYPVKLLLRLQLRYTLELRHAYGLRWNHLLPVLGTHNEIHHLKVIKDSFAAVRQQVDSLPSSATAASVVLAPPAAPRKSAAAVSEATLNVVPQELKAKGALHPSMRPVQASRYSLVGVRSGRGSAAAYVRMPSTYIWMCS